MRIKNKFQLGNYKLIQNQILQTNITRTILQKVIRELQVDPKPNSPN